ncbi:carboxypeptidase [Ketogulonicigenium robustum]|nr:carboxypeptidase [Ketogulonicigenium robustum]
MTVDLTRGESARILDYCRKARLTTAQTAYVMATALWETNKTMLPVEEAYWLSDTWRRKNLRYYPWHGRGFVQLTWEANYRKAGHLLGCDLTRDPARAMQPDIAARILVRGMCEGWFTNQRLDQFITAARHDFIGARRVVNGTDRADEIAALARDYHAALQDAAPRRVSWISVLLSFFMKGKVA